MKNLTLLKERCYSFSCTIDSTLFLIFSVVIDVRPTPMPKFVRQAKCVNGKRAMCVTKYETMCTNKEVTHEMMEDYPM